MPVTVLVGAVAIVGAIPLALWSLLTGREQRSRPVVLLPGEHAQTDLRRLLLTKSARERVLAPAMAAAARRARRVTPGGIVASLEQKLVLAGHPWTIENVLAAKFVAALAAGALGLLVWLGDRSVGLLLLVFGLVVVAYSAPDFVVGRRARQRQETIQRQISGTLDQISISVEAGLGFEAALARVGQTMSGPLAEELLRTLQDIRLGVRRRDAMHRLLDRTDVDDLRRFVNALRQAEEYGIPIAQVLRVQSAELRDKRRQRAEEEAMKLPVKVIFPVIFCVLPSLMIVILGPMIVRFAQGELFPT